LRSYPGYAEAVHRADGLNGLFAQATGALRDVYDFMRLCQLAQTDSLIQFFDLSWMNDSLLTGLCLTFFRSRWLPCQAFDAPKNIKIFVL